MVFLRKELAARMGFKSLPLTITILCSFIGCVMHHEHAAERLAVTDAVRTHLLGADDEYGTDIWENIETADDVWYWMSDAFIPNVLDSIHDETYLQYNRIIGGARLLVQRRLEGNEYCVSPGWITHPSETARRLDMPCMEVIGTVKDEIEYGIDQLAFEPKGRETTSWSAGPSFDELADKVDRKFFMLSDNSTGHKSTLEAALGAGFMDRRVRQMQVSFVMYNADYNVWCLAEVNFFFCTHRAYLEQAASEYRRARAVSGHVTYCSFRCALPWHIDMDIRVRYSSFDRHLVANGIFYDR